MYEQTEISLRLDIPFGNKQRNVAASKSSAVKYSNMSGINTRIGGSSDNMNVVCLARTCSVIGMSG